MKWIKIPFLFLWRIWFYVLLTITIILMSPALLILTSKNTLYPILWKMIRIWSYILIYGMGFRLQKEFEQKADINKSYLFCPNHTSLMDPFVLIAISKNPIVFVGKIELTKIPIFGFFYKRTVILVDRDSHKSRKQVYGQAKKRLEGGTSIGIFPEGLVPDYNVVLAPFKDGAFKLAAEFEIPIVPQTYFDCKRYFSWNIFKGGLGTFRVKQHKFIETKGISSKEDIASLKQRTFEIIQKELMEDESYMKDTNYKK